VEVINKFTTNPNKQKQHSSLHLRKYGRNSTPLFFPASIKKSNPSSIVSETKQKEGPLKKIN